MKKPRLHLDYNATTALHPAVSKVMQDARFLSGNPSSLYASGRAAKAEVENARATLAEAIGAQREQWVFTGSGSEANNLVIKSVLFEMLEVKKPAHIITSSIEHSSVREAVIQCGKMGVEVTVVGCDNRGRVSVSEIEASIQPHTRLISIQLANNEVGTLQPISDIATLAKKRGVLCHTDAVQVFGKMPLHVGSLGVDFMSVSAHKLYGPKGIGGLYVREDSTLTSLISGGSQERKLRAGTEAVQAILGFAEAVRQVEPMRDYTDIRKLFIQAAHESVPDLVVHTPLDQSLPNTLSLGFPGVDAHGLAIALDLEGIEVSTGSACSAGSVDPSPVLEAMGVSAALNKATLRLSFGAQTQETDSMVFTEALKKVLPRLRS